jgi:hypothetical protein
VVCREDEVRCVTGGTTWVRQWALVDEHHVGPTELAQVANETVAHDSGADNDTLCATWKFTHEIPPKRGPHPRWARPQLNFGSISAQYHHVKIGI